MILVGIKNKTKKHYTGMFAGRAYDFAPGDMRLVASEIAKHLSDASVFSPVGDRFLHIIPVEKIEGEMKADPGTKCVGIVRVENPGKTKSVTMYDAKEYLIMPGGFVLVSEDIAQEIMLRDRNLKRGTMAAPKAPAQSPSPAEKNSAEKSAQKKDKEEK